MKTQSLGRWLINASYKLGPLYGPVWRMGHKLCEIHRAKQLSKRFKLEA